MTPCALRKMAPWSAPCCADCGGQAGATDGSTQDPRPSQGRYAALYALGGAAAFYALAKSDGSKETVRMLYAAAGGFFGYTIGKGL